MATGSMLIGRTTVDLGNPNNEVQAQSI
jgi:hypothetical protein